MTQTTLADLVKHYEFQSSIEAKIIMKQAAIITRLRNRLLDTWEYTDYCEFTDRVINETDPEKVQI